MLQDVNNTSDGKVMASGIGKGSEKHPETLKLITERIEVLLKQGKEKSSNCSAHGRHTHQTDLFAPIGQPRNFVSCTSAATTP